MIHGGWKLFQFKEQSQFLSSLVGVEEPSQKWLGSRGSTEPWGEGGWFLLHHDECQDLWSEGLDSPHTCCQFWVCGSEFLFPLWSTMKGGKSLCVCVWERERETEREREKGAKGITDLAPYLKDQWVLVWNASELQIKSNFQHLLPV